MTDITGIGKVLPMEKLLDVLSSAFGRVSKSYFDKKDVESKVYEIQKIAEAKAYELKVIEKAKSDISQEESNFLERTEERILYKELKKQKNIEAIAKAAAEQLKQEETVSEDPVEEDWSNRFFNYAEDVTNEEMQKLWGRILAGEIKRPNSYSLRTLEFIRNLSREEASIFNRVGKCAVLASGKYFLNEEIVKNSMGISLDDILVLKELGLLNTSELQLELKNQMDSDLLFLYGGRALIVKRTELSSVKHLQGTVFTKLGGELLSLITIQYNEEVFRQMKQKLQDNSSVEFKIGNYIVANNQIYLNNLKEFN